MKYDTIKEATQAWVSEMSAIPQSLLKKAYPNMDEDGLYELTPTVMKWECDSCGEFSDGEIEKLQEDGHVDNFDNIICPTCFKAEKEHYDEYWGDNGDFTLNDCVAYVEQVEDEESHEYGLPMWGWLWNPKSIDEDWVRNNLEIVSECGFRIYESDEVGILLGIDGAGYDFYEEHWIPLYKARGLEWHKEEVGV